jgi:pimeloyl-ACP methyl ester carboxylesterase
MRKSARVVVLFILGMLSTAVLGVVGALMAAVSLAATALIVPGTGTPMAGNVALYEQHAVDRYITPFVPDCTFATCHPTGVDYPASFFPLVIFPGWCEPGRCETWNDSVGTGVESLITNLQNVPDANGPVTLFGYSQGGAVVSNALRQLEGNPLLDKVGSIVLIGNAYNPDGGIFTRLGFLPTIPFLNVTFGPATPTDTGIPMTSIGFQYDPVMYAPKYWGNPLSMLNAVAALETVHGNYLTPNGNGPTDPIAYGYTETELKDFFANTQCPSANCRVDSHGNKYYMIPAKSLPMFDFVMSQLPAPLLPFAKPFVDLATPVTRVLVDLGYDWSGDPGKTQWLSPLPFNPIQNWPGVGVNLVTATVEGIQAFLGDLGGIVPTTTAPTTPDVSTLSALSTQTSEVPSAPQDKSASDAQNVIATAVSQGSAAGTAADQTSTDETATGETDSDTSDSAQEARDAAKAERAAQREEAKAARDAARADRAAARAEAKAARAAAKADSADGAGADDQGGDQKAAA